MQHMPLGDMPVSYTREQLAGMTDSEPKLFSMFIVRSFIALPGKKLMSQELTSEVVSRSRQVNNLTNYRHTVLCYN